MFVFCSAAKGGDGTFAPVSTIYNKLKQSSPDLIPVLMQSDWPFNKYVYLVFILLSPLLQFELNLPTK